MSQVFPILVPQLNVNDETVLLGDWLVEAGAVVKPGDLLCEVETSKAAMELEAEHAGVVVPDTAPQSTVRVGERLGWIGPSVEAIAAHRASEAEAGAESALGKLPSAPVQATARARALAEQHGIALEQVASMGVVGTIKEADVQRYLEAQQRKPERAELEAAGDLPPALSRYLVREGQLSRHELFVRQSLQESLRNVLLATLDVEVELTAINEWIRRAQADGMMLSVLHVALCALGRTLPHFPRLISFLHQRELYQYRQLDVAFVVRSQDGLLYTPVVREVDRLGAEEIARACQTAVMRVHRGRITPEELEGACFTVSSVATPGVTRFVALPNRFQSAILAIAAEQSRLAMREGQVTEVPVATLTLSYDHALCDGVYAAEFLSRLIKEMERTLG